MKKRLLIFLLFFTVLVSVAATDFLPDGGTADIADGKITKAYFDFAPVLYEYHSFNFTGSPISGPDDVLAPLSDLYLKKSDLGYTHDTNDLYFSYSFKGKKNFEVLLTGADLKPRYRQGEVDQGQYFSTVTTVTYPAGYIIKKEEVKSAASSRQTGGTYNSIVVLPNTKVQSNKTVFGRYGSLKLSVVATYIPAGAEAKPLKVTDGYEGVFTLECNVI